MADVLIANSLSRQFEVGGSVVQAVRGASLRVGESEIVAVLGRSGAGTTTLLSMCGGLERPDEGAVVVAGRDLAYMNGPEREVFLTRTVGWVPQRPSLLPLLTLEENVSVVLRLAGESAAQAARAARTALEALGLRKLAARRGADLSATERRCAALARALVKAPALLVADQPTADLDTTAASAVLALMREAAASGASVLFGTQDEWAAGAADRALLMEKGFLTAP